MIWDYVEENSGTAIKQMKKLGASADWSRTKFTLDKDVVAMVVDTFKKLYDDGLVYREVRLVNYCTSCGTAFSNLEVKHVERVSPLYYMKYGPFTLATTRPETKFGDTAIEVHPDDKRYQKWIGQEVEVKGLAGKFKMRVIADRRVDRKFGTGVVKVTPAHDFNDFDVYLKHKKEVPGPKQVIGFDGRMNQLAGKYQGLKVMEARKAVVADLTKRGLMEKVDETYRNTIGVCYRCGTTIEPLPLPQFYIKVKPLTQRALRALKEKKVKIFGAGYDKILNHWLKSLDDWNVSRQIVWGIRLPIWYEADKNPEVEVKFLNKDKKLISDQVGELLKNYSLAEIKRGLQSLRAPLTAKFTVSPTSPGENFLQETDTFDTWFSSSQWPLVTLKTSRFKDDFKRFYPTSLMETAYDILIFWVMRMLFMGLYLTGKVPFEKVYLHGLIRDEKGQKMSKSKGNVVDPVEVIQKYGADALRMALVIRSTAGRDKNVGDDDIRGMRNLTNKIWNAARFVIVSNNTHSEHSRSGVAPAAHSGSDSDLKDEKFKKELSGVVKQITDQLEAMKPGLAAETVYFYFWHWFCDECIEQNKQGKISPLALIKGLRVFLKLLHPFVPFVTEAVWRQLPKTEEKLLIGAQWPA